MSMARLTLLKAMWDGKRPPRPWSANAWIIDLKSRSVVWELSAAQTSRGRGDTQEFSGATTLPPGAYQAFYAFYPPTYWSDTDKPDKQKPPGPPLERDGRVRPSKRLD